MYRLTMIPSARTGLRLAGAGLVLLGVIYVALFFFLQSSAVRIWLQSELSERSGAETRVGSFRLLPPMSIRAEQVEIAKPGQFVLTSRRITATFTPLDLFSQTLHRLRFDEPRLQVEIAALDKSPERGAGAIALRNLNVNGGTLVLSKDSSVMLEVPKINVTAENFNLGEKAGLSLHADVPQLDGVMELTLSRRLADLRAEVVVRSKTAPPPVSAPGTDGGTPELLRLRAGLHLPEQAGAEVTLESRFENLAAANTRLSGALDARIELDPEFAAAAFTGRWTLRRLPRTLAPPAGKLANGPATASFSGRFAIPEKRLSVDSLELLSPIGSGFGAGEVFFAPQAQITKAHLSWRNAPLDLLQSLVPAPWNRWSYSGRGHLEADIKGTWNAVQIKGTARSDDFQVHGGFFKAAAIKLAVPFDWDAPSLEIKQATLDVAGLNYTGENRWHASTTRLQATASAAVGAGEPLKLTARFAASGGKFNSPDSAKIGENFSLEGELDLAALSRPDTLRVAGKVNINTGEVLWGKFFGDFKARRPELLLDVDFSSNADRLDCRRCRLNLVEVGAVELSGFIERLSAAPELHLQARSENFSPAGFFNFFLRDTYNRQYPLLDQVALGGQLAFQSELRGGLRDLGIDGELALKAGELRVKSWNWQVGPFALALPFQLRWSDARSISPSKPRIGALSIDQARFGGQFLGPIKTTLSLTSNALRFHQPIRLSMFGGEVSIGNLFWPDLLNDPKQLSFSLNGKQLELQGLTRAFNWPAFSGTLTGSIPEVQSAGNTLRTNGEIQAELFGGRIRMTKLELDNFFSSLAAIKLDARLTNIELEQLSKTFAFGRISGILEGTIDDLVVTAGQPAEFRADLHSVDRGTEQRISVEALNKITVLSSGQSAGALYGGLAGFFDSFRYSKLGFKAVLLNDRLTLRGVETRGNQEYLVVGSFLPPTVNIVSHTQIIAFSELMRRVERIKSDQPEVK